MLNKNINKEQAIYTKKLDFVLQKMNLKDMKKQINLKMLIQSELEGLSLKELKQLSEFIKELK
jgi:hypothetical protein